MTTYNSYEEAKIENPECEIYQLERNGLFAHCDYHKDELVRFVEFDSAGIKCNPADHCMTGEKFLADGYEFVEGDVILQNTGKVTRVDDNPDWNIKDSMDVARFILRAAALEENLTNKVEPTIENAHAYLGVLENACSELSCDVGHLLINIKGLIKTNKEYATAIASHGVNNGKPRTKVEYVKCEFDSMWEAVKAFEDGDVFHTHFMTDGWVIVEHVQQVIPNLQVEKLYRRIETPMTDRDVFIEAAMHELESGMSDRDYAKALFDSGKFKLVN